MVIALLEMTLPRADAANTIGALLAFWDSTRVRPGCLGGGVFREVGASDTALYIERWQDVGRLEAHLRSRGYGRLLAIMETAAAPPVLRFDLVAETRGLEWVGQLRIGAAGVLPDGA